MKLVKITLSIVVLVVLSSCGNSTDKKNDSDNTQTNKKESVKIEPAEMLYSWCNNDDFEETGVFFHLWFNEENGELKASYSNGGPFEILFKVELQDDKVLLYFLGAPGSISFAEIFDNNETFKKDSPMAICYKPVGDKMEVEVKQTVTNVFAEMGKHTLTKLKEDDFCRE